MDRPLRASLAAGSKWPWIHGRGGGGGDIIRFRLDRTTAKVPPTTIAIAIAAKTAYASAAGRPKIVLPADPPSVAPDGFTVTVTVAFVLRLAAAVTVTLTAKVPVAVGVHVRVDTFADEQPDGKPAYA